MTYTPKPLPEGFAGSVKCYAKYGSTNRRAIMRNISDFFDPTFDIEANRLHNEAVHNWYCVYCGDWIPDENGIIRKQDVAWDHFYPVRHWGIKTLGNFLVSCPDCNSEKSATSPVEYYEQRLAAGASTHFASLEEFKEFIEVFTAPFRDAFPYEHNLASTYKIEDETEESWRRELDRFLSSKDSEGNPVIEFTSTGESSVLREKSASGPVFAELWMNETRTSVPGSIARLQNHFDEKFPGRDPLTLTVREFSNLQYSALFFTLSHESSSSFGFMKNAIELLAGVLDSHNGSKDYSDVFNKVGGSRAWIKRIDSKYIGISRKTHRAEKRAKLESRATRLRRQADALDLQADALDSEDEDDA